MLQVVEIFRSLQGESSFAGLPCAFVRLAGCNLRCRYCDTEYAYAGGKAVTVDQVVDQVKALQTPLVEVTGGEPLLQPEAAVLLDALCAVAETVLVETNGTVPLPPEREWIAIMDIKCPGSGESDRVCWDNIERLKTRDEVKFVVSDRRDFDWSVQQISRHGLSGLPGQIIFSAVAGTLQPAELAEWLLHSGLQARLQLQLHKLLWPNEPRGV